MEGVWKVRREWGRKGRTEGGSEGERNFLGAHPVAAEQRLIYMHYFDFKLFLARLLLYSLLHT